VGPRGNLGFLCRGIQIQVALSPELALMIGDPSTYGVDADEIDQLTEDNLLHYNSLLAGWAHRWLYSRSGDFDVRPGMYRSGPRFAIR
jgi:CheY-specific phosphatase CheX